MSLVQANHVAVLSGSITRPLVGVWIADLVLDQPDGSGFAPGTAVTITSENGYSLSGTVDPNRTGDFLDAVHVRVRGGAAGTGKTASNRSYVQPGAFARDVLNGLMSDSGEKLSITVDAGFMSTNLTAWSCMANTVAWNIQALIKIVQPTFSWRILADGTLWIGAESWPSASGTFDVMSQNPADGSYEIGQESPFIVPGTSLAGVGNINRVVDTISAGRLRSRVWLDLPTEGNRGLYQAIQRMVKQAMAGIDYYATYMCEVVSQSTDMTTVDIKPHGARNKGLIGGLQRVPVRFGNGIKVQFVQGATVLLGWDGGDPSQSYVCCGLSGDTPTSASMTATQSAQIADGSGDSLTASGGHVTTKVGNSTMADVSSSGVTLGSNPIKTPVLTVGSVDSMGVPVTNSPTNTGVVQAG